ncbi:MAG TPA: tail fiber protein [Chthoniobacterales bacterium]|nr:tail fiber protein [Chthoniobacterales bacterium]
MANPFVAEIRIFGFKFAPKGWAFCNGQILPISQNTALFSLLGTTYGGNGQSTFALPNMQDSAPMQPGQGPGLSLHDLGEVSGSDTVTLLTSEMPSHPHTLQCVTSFAGSANLPTGNVLAKTVDPFQPYTPTVSPLGQMAFQDLAPAGGSLPHNNMMPFLTLNFCIALQGVFPPRG